MVRRNGNWKPFCRDLPGADFGVQLPKCIISAKPLFSLGVVRLSQGSEKLSINNPRTNPWTAAAINKNLWIASIGCYKYSVRLRCTMTHNL